jgi:hypothetical protein
MKILLVLLLVWSAKASTIVLEVYYIDHDEILKTVPVIGTYDYKVTSLCKDNYKYNIIRAYSGDVSTQQDLETSMNGAIPTRCKHEK